jgi:hypothetical protein
MPTFRVGDAFPPGDHKRVSLVRFLVAAQSLSAITRVIPVLPEADAYRESKHYLMLFSLGAAYEAANAFWGALQHDLFAPLSSLTLDEIILAEIGASISRLTVDCDPICPDSLRSKLVRRVRNNFSFHWDMGRVRRSLAEVEDEIVPAWAGGSNFIANALPIVERVTLKGLEILAGSEGELWDLMERVPLFTMDLVRVAEAAYAEALGVALGGKRSSNEISTDA